MAIQSTWEDITPTKAFEYLETAVALGPTDKDNRRIRQTKIDSYSSMMRAGLWRKTHQGIAFNNKGQLVDGQHRMWSVIEADMMITFMVSRGLTDDDVLAIDRGLARSYEDVAHYQGWNTDPTTGAIAMILGNGAKAASVAIPPDILHGWYEHWQAGIDFAIELRNGSRPRTGKSITVPMAAALARASYCIKDDVLRRFMEILKTGQFTVDADRAAFVLREAWLSGRLGRTRAEQYFKTEGALRAFNDRRAIKTLQQPEAECFEIPALPRALRFNVKDVRRSKRAGVEVRKKFKQQQAETTN